jgi:hypothetical protein
MTVIMRIRMLPMISETPLSFDQDFFFLASKLMISVLRGREHPLATMRIMNWSVFKRVAVITNYHPEKSACQVRNQHD